MDFKRTVPKPFYQVFGEVYDDSIWNRENAENEALKDYGYLRATCPATILQFQKKIAEIMDRLDYEGSMIYDEFPDKFSMMQLAKTITKMLTENGDMALPDKTDILQLMLCDEIYKRRLSAGKKGYYGIQTGNRGFIK